MTHHGEGSRPRSRRPRRFVVEVLEPRFLLALLGPGAPTVTTLPATNVTGTTAILNGSVNPNGSPTNVAFQISALANLPANMVTTLAGAAGTAGSADGTGGSAGFAGPAGVAVDLAGSVYVADASNATIRKITPGGVVTTLAGSPGSTGSADGTGSAARFFSPEGVAVDLAGNVYVADSGNETIRKITPGGAVTTLAGSPGLTGSADGTGSAARFNQPLSLTVDSAGNVYVADRTNDTIRKITPAGVVTTLAGLAGTTGSADGTGSAARFNGPAGVATDLAGNVYVADTFNDTIREVTPAGVVTTLAGLAGAIGSTDGTGSSARFNRPVGVAVDNVGNVYVADAVNQTIREVTPAGAVTTLAGTVGVIGSADGTGTAAQFNLPLSVAVDGVGTVYVADAQNDTVRRLSIASIAIPSSVSGPSAVAANAGLMGLAVGTTYFFRAVAASAAGGAEGAILSFTTSGVTSTSTSPVTVTALTVTRATAGPKGHGPKGLALDVQFSGALNAAAAQDLAAYTVFAGHVKKGRKGSASQVLYSTPVPLAQAIYSPSANSVMLLPRGKPKLTKFEQLHVNVSIVTDPVGRSINNGKSFTATVTSAGLVISAG